MIFFVFQCVLGTTVAWISWLVLRRFVLTSPLDNIPGPPSEGFLMGNLGQLYNSNGWDFHKQLAEAYESVVKIGGLFGSKELYVLDPLAMHHILLEDQDVYEETSVFREVHRLIFAHHNKVVVLMLGCEGDQHRKQRKMLNPAFSTAHLRQMVPTFCEITEKVRHVLESKVKDGPQEVEMVQWMARTALEAIGQAGLGYSFDPLTEEEPSDPYAKSIKQLLPTVFGLSVLLQLLPTVVLIPLSIRRILVELIPSKSVRKLKGIVKIMDHTAQSVFKEKKKYTLQKGEVQKRKDIIGILLETNMEAEEESRLSDSELVAQMSTLTFAAMDTTSSAICRIFYLLSQHPDVQDKLRHEIAEARQTDIYPNHDDIVALPMLDAVVKESLRLHPPTFSVSRTAQTDVLLPVSTPIRCVDGTMLSAISVPKNTNVMIAITAANRSKTIWGDDASEWKPERWLGGGGVGVGKEGIKLPGVYSNMMTFLGGGRACIGFKFSELEIKVILFILIASFKFSLSEKEVTWVMSSITVPMADGKLQMPLNVALV